MRNHLVYENEIKWFFILESSFEGVCIDILLANNVL